MHCQTIESIEGWKWKHFSWKRLLAKRTLVFTMDNASNRAFHYIHILVPQILCWPPIQELDIMLDKDRIQPNLQYAISLILIH